MIPLTRTELRWDLQARWAALEDSTSYLSGDAWRADRRVVARAFVFDHLRLTEDDLNDDDRAFVEWVITGDESTITGIVRLGLLSRR